MIKVQPVEPAARPAPIAGRIGHDRSPIGRSIDGWCESMAARKKKPTSIARFRAKVTECAAFNDWKTAADVSYQGAVRWLAAKQEDGWGPATANQAVSILRRFGRYLHTGARELPDNPMAALEGNGEQGGEGSRALTTEEARAIIRAAYARARADGRARGNAGLFIGFLCLTGLRAGEAAAVKWGDLEKGAAEAAPRTERNDSCLTRSIVLWTDPAWAKNKRRQPVYLAPQLAVRLEEHRRTVPDGPTDPIFPVTPNRHTWGALREAAGIPAGDSRGEQATMHSCRKWLASILDEQGASPGLVSAILRHADTLAEERYIKKSAESQVLAVSALPQLFPEDEHGKRENPEGFNLHRPKSEVMVIPATTGSIMQATTLKHESDTPGSPADGSFVAVASISNGLPDASDSIEHGPTHCRAGTTPAQAPHLDALTAAFLASHETLRAAVAARIGGGL